MSSEILFLGTAERARAPFENERRQTDGDGEKKMQECSIYFWRILFLPRVLSSLWFFFLFNDRIPFELALPNSAGKTILTVLVYVYLYIYIMKRDMRRVYRVSQKCHWTVRNCIKSPALLTNSFFAFPLYNITTCVCVCTSQKKIYIKYINLSSLRN